MPQSSHIIFCNCSHWQVLPEETKAEVLAALKEAKVSFEAVDDLCRIAANETDRIDQWAKIKNLKIAACFPRAVKWLFGRSGAHIGGNVKFYNLREDSPEEIVKGLLTDAPIGEADIKIEKIGDWTPWFPVIDYDLCVNCKQCLNFCLFGVYGTDEDDKVKVVKPAGCKTGCPACARVCPNSAIIFPKYTDAPINGDEVSENPVRPDKIDLSVMKGGDIRAAIRARSKKHEKFAVTDGDKVLLSNQQKALRLAKLQQALDIPDEVIANLSAEDIAAVRTNAPDKDCPNSEFCDKDCEKVKDTAGEE